MRVFKILDLGAVDPPDLAAQLVNALSLVLETQVGDHADLRRQAGKIHERGKIHRPRVRFIGADRQQMINPEIVTEDTAMALSAKTLKGDTSRNLMRQGRDLAALGVLDLANLKLAAVLDALHPLNCLSQRGIGDEQTRE